MSINVILTMSRPDTSTEFWWKLPSNDQYSELVDSIHTILEITVTDEESSDGLTMTRTIIAGSEEVWGKYMETVLSIGDLINERNKYCMLNNHRLTLTKTNTETGLVNIIDPLAILSEE